MPSASTAERLYSQEKRYRFNLSVFFFAGFRLCFPKTHRNRGFYALEKLRKM